MSEAVHTALALFGCCVVLAAFGASAAVGWWLVNRHWHRWTGWAIGSTRQGAGEFKSIVRRCHKCGETQARWNDKTQEPSHAD